MKKKILENPIKVQGWGFLDNFIGNCTSCKKRIHSGEPTYWRINKIDHPFGMEEIVCRECSDK